jgi:hypothetical protein
MQTKRTRVSKILFLVYGDKEFYVAENLPTVNSVNT